MWILVCVVSFRDWYFYIKKFLNDEIDLVCIFIKEILFFNFFRCSEILNEIEIIKSKFVIYL